MKLRDRVRTELWEAHPELAGKITVTLFIVGAAAHRAARWVADSTREKA